MKLINLSVENFGVLHAYSLDCTTGLNVFCRENGAGKTTLAAFLCAMLYGLPASRKNDLSENDRKKYLPWQGGPFGGSITFSVHGKTYRAERRFSEGSSARRDTFALYDLSDNTLSDDYTEALGYELFGLDAEAFERSAYLPQKLLSGERTNETITARLNRAIGGDSEEGAGLYRTAAAVLDRQRQYYVKHGGRGYIADLEQSLSELHEKEYAALQAKADAERHAADAQIISEEIAALGAQKQALAEAQTAAVTREAVWAHGLTLLAHRDDRLSSAAEKRQFLHLDEDGDAARERYGEDAIRRAEALLPSYLRLCARLDETEAHTMRIGAEQERIAALFGGEIPDNETLGTLTALAEALGAEGPSEMDTDLPFPACFSEEELQRHTEQARVHAQMTEILAKPKSAEEAYFAACRDAQIDDGESLPDDDTLQAYDDALQTLAENRGKQALLLPQKQEADAAKEAFAKEHNAIPDQQEIVAMRSRFDALRSRTEEIEELEARQRLAVKVHESIRRSRRIRIGIGVGLLLAAAALCMGYVLGSDMRFLIAGGVTALPGLTLLILGLFTSPEENDETRALEDAALKRLCAKKSEFEVEKGSIYEFLDRLGGTAEAVFDEQEAVQRFDAAASAAREWEALQVRVKELDEQLQVLSTAEAQLCASLSSYTKSGGGEIADIGEDRAVFAEYRRGVQRCQILAAAYEEECEMRAQAQARQNALALALDRYFAQLSEHCPPSVQKCGETDNGSYADRMAAWCRTADLLRLQMGERDRIAAHRRAAENELAEQLARLTADGAELSVSDRAKNVIRMCAQYRALTQERAALEEQRADWLGQRQVQDAWLQMFLGGYFSDPLPSAAEGLQIIRAKTAALAEDMAQLRDAQRQLSAFLSEHDLTEAALSASADGTDRAEDIRTSMLALETAMQQKTAQRAAAMQEAEQASRIGASLAQIRAQIAQTEQTLAQAQDALATIRRTQEYLEAAKTALSTRYLSYMQARFRDYWARMTGVSADAAGKMMLDGALSVQTEALGEWRETAYFSRGTQDCIDFCVRLALIDAMYTDGGTKTDAPHPPLLLDDPFVNLDREHLAAARRLLDEIADRFQILYFVCHDSRM